MLFTAAQTAIYPTTPIHSQIDPPRKQTTQEGTSPGSSQYVGMINNNININNIRDLVWDLSGDFLFSNLFDIVII